MSLWEFENVTRDFIYKPSVQSLSISNAQPCQLALLTARIQADAAFTFAEHDEMKARFNSVLLHAGHVSEYDRLGTGQFPRTYQLTVQDYTARLKRDVIDVNRKVAETVTARVLWILSHSTQGYTTTGVATINDEVDPLDTAGMTVPEALAATAGEIGASYFVNFAKDVQFFVTPTAGAAPFALRSTDSPSYVAGDPQMSDFDIKTDAEPQANAYLVRGDGVKVWRTDDPSIATHGRIEAPINDPNIKTLRRARRRGDAALIHTKDPVVTGSAVVTEPGLLPMQTVRVDARTNWTVNADMIVQSTAIGYLSPVKMEMLVEFADRFRPCFVRETSAAQLAQDDTGGGGGGDDPDEGGEVDRMCLDCLRVVQLLPSGLDDAFALAFGARLGVYVYDGATMAKYSCGLEHIWTISLSGSNALNVGHEPVRNVPILAAPYGIDKIAGLTRWNIGGTWAAAASQDRRRFWAVTSGGAIDFVGISTLSIGAGADLPTGWQAGDLAIVGAQGLTTAPSGWTLDRTDTVNGWDTIVASRVLQSGDTMASLGWGNNQGLLIVYRNASGVSGTPTFASAGFPASTTTIPATTAGDFVLGFAFVQGQSVYDDAPSGMTNRSGPIASYVTFMMADVPGDWAGGTISHGGSFASRGYGIGITSSGSGGVGTQLQRRTLVTGGLVNGTGLSQATTQIRATPNGQHLFVLLGANTLERYARDLTLEDTVTITGFSTGLQDWNVDDDYNIYRLVGNVLTKYNRDGEQLWTKDLFAAEGYRFPTRGYSEGTGQMVMVDEHIRVAGYLGGASWASGSQAMLLTISRTFGHVRSVELFGDDSTKAQAVAVARNGPCLILAGAAEGSAFEDESMSGTRGWVMRIKAALAE